jgi:acyl carrier protein
MVTVDDVSDLILQKLRGRLPDGMTLAADTRLEDLALSSLQLADVVFMLEEDNAIELDVARVADAVTLGDLTAVANDALLGAASGTPGGEGGDGAA